MTLNTKLVVNKNVNSVKIVCVRKIKFEIYLMFVIRIKDSLI